MVWKARSRDLNKLRSPNLNARKIDIFDAAAEKDESKLIWQFITYDANPYIAHNIFYWDSFDEQEHPNMTARFKEYKAAKAEDPDQDDKTRTVETGWRNPGRSDKVWDQHYVDLEDLYSLNTKAKDSPQRAIRIVMVEHIPNPNAIQGVGNLEIDDNNQCFTFQFYDHNKGWKFFCPHLANELKMALAAEKKFSKFDSYYLDTRMGKVGRTKIDIDLDTMTQQGRSKRAIRAVWVTPVYQKGVWSEPTTEPDWSKEGPRIDGIGPPLAAPSHAGATAASAATTPGEASTKKLM